MPALWAKSIDDAQPFNKLANEQLRLLRGKESASEAFSFGVLSPDF